MNNFLLHLANLTPFATPAHYDNAFFGLNAALRDPNGYKIYKSSVANFDSTNHNQTHISDLEILENIKTEYNREFMFLPKTLTRKKMYRGACRLCKEDYDVYMNYEKGSVVVPDSGFAYLTKSKNIAMEYANRSEKPILFEYKIPRKSLISRFNKYFILITGKHIPTQSVLPAGAVCKVYKNSCVDRDGVLHVFLKYLNRWK